MGVPGQGVFVLREVFRVEGGFTHQRGSHLLLKNPGTVYRATVPIHSLDLPKGFFLKILKDAGFSLDDYSE